MGKVISSAAGQVVTLLAWDGSNLRNVVVDSDGKLTISGTVSIDTTDLATEDKQDDIITELQGLSPTGDFANQTKQTAIESAIDDLPPAGGFATEDKQDDIVSELQGLSFDTTVEAEGSWTTIMNAQRLDDDPTEANSSTHDVDGWAGAWVLFDIDSNGSPTRLRATAQFSDDNGTTWWDYKINVWAALLWEDQDTASGLTEAILLPCGGIDDVRIHMEATGSGASDYFDVTIKIRAFRGGFASDV